MREVEEKRIIDAAFDVFVREKIEVASMAEIAREAGVGRATVFRHYPGKLDLVIAVNSAKWKEYLDELDRKRPISSVDEIPAIDRFIFTLDCYIDMYVNHKALLQFNDNFNHFVSHSGVDGKKLKGFNDSLLSADTRFIKMYEKAKEDHTLRTDIPFEEFMRQTVHVMMAVCTYYANGFIWGSDRNKDYITELTRIKEMLVSFAKDKR